MIIIMKNQINIFVSDLDGTLLNANKRVNSQDAKAVQVWIDHGKHFWVASGRGHDCRKLLAKDGVYPEYVIGSTGSTIHDANDQQIYAFDGHINQLDQIVDYLLSRTYCGFMFDQISGETINHSRRYGVNTNALVSNHIHQPLDDIILATTLDLTRVCVSKIFAVFSNDALAVASAKELIQQFDVMAYHADTNCLEIVPKGCSKAGALSWLCHHLNIDMNHVAAIGDAENDVKMIQHCGYGYIMNTADPDYHQYANQTVNSVSEAIHDLLNGSTNI